MNSPTGFKQRLGAELALLEQARDERATEEAAGPAARVAARRGPVRSRVRRTAPAALAVGAVAVVIIATSGGQGAQTEPVHALTVAEVLDAAAANAAKGTDKEPGPHQWLYTDTVSCDNDCGHQPSWQRYDGAKSASVGKTHRTGDRTVVSVTSGSPLPGKRIEDRPQETREVLSRLPTDPRKLLERVSTDPFFAGGPDASDVPADNTDMRHDFRAGDAPAVTPGARFARIVHILQAASSIPPRVNAALYRALALIPGAELVDAPARDAAGRPGLTIRFDFHNVSRTREYLFLDPRTYAYRGSRTDWHGESDFSASFARLATAVVDHPGQVPGGPAPDPSDVVEEPPVLIVDLPPAPLASATRPRGAGE